MKLSRREALQGGAAVIAATALPSPVAAMLAELYLLGGEPWLARDYVAMSIQVYEKGGARPPVE